MPILQKKEQSLMRTDQIKLFVGDVEPGLGARTADLSLVFPPLSCSPPYVSGPQRW